VSAFFCDCDLMTAPCICEFVAAGCGDSAAVMTMCNFSSSFSGDSSVNVYMVMCPLAMCLVLVNVLWAYWIDRILITTVMIANGLGGVMYVWRGS